MIYVTQLCTAASNMAKREELLIGLFDMKIFYEDCFQSSRWTLIGTHVKESAQFKVSLKPSFGARLR